MEGTCPRREERSSSRPGFLRVEGIPAFGNASPFVGWRRNECLGRLMRTVGASSPPYEGIDDMT